MKIVGVADPTIRAQIWSKDSDCTISVNIVGGRGTVLWESLHLGIAYHFRRGYCTLK